MTVKTILVSMNDTGRAKELLTVASRLAQRFDAHVKGLYIIPAIEVYPTGGMQLSAQVFEGHRKFYLDHAEKMRELFEETMRRDAVLHEWFQKEITSPLIADGVVEHALEAGLVIVSQAHKENANGLEPGFAEQVIMESGRPVLVIPAYGTFEDVGHNVLAAWNGTRESARAVFDSLAVIKPGADITLAWLNPEDDLPADEDLPGTEMAATLGRHGFNATAQAAPTGGLDTGDAFLSLASDLGSDMLVMGAYGHSRMREFVFGGTTRTILESMTLPVLMSH